MNRLQLLYKTYGSKLWKHIPAYIPEREQIDARYCMWFSENVGQHAPGNVLRWFADTLDAVLAVNPEPELVNARHIVFELEDEFFGPGAAPARVDPSE